jgi:hypothetical protein
MTEQQWLSCKEPGSMLGFLRKSGGLSERKARLFACACCRTVWHLLHKRARKAVAVAEDYVDGLAPKEVWEARRHDIRNYGGWRSFALKMSVAAAHAKSAVHEVFADQAADGLGCWWAVVQARLAENEEEDPALVMSALAALVRELAGNPFRPVAFEVALQRWNGGAAVALAADMYESRDFRQAPLLADMLEDAGTTEAQLLDHLRGHGPHTRGCFAVDLVLGKE